MCVEIDRGAIGAGFSDYSAAVLKMLDVLSYRENLQNSLLFKRKAKRVATTYEWASEIAS